MARYSIKDLEQLSGIKAHTIRIWEKRYNLVRPGRTGTNIRFYNDDDLKKILNISILNRNGIKISHIAQLDDKNIGEKVAELTKNQFDSEVKIDHLVITMMELDEKRFDKLINMSIMQAGFEETVLHTIYPFLHKVGILWQTGVISPAQEHFVSNLIRQKLILAIDGIIEHEKADAKHFILFLPEGELHEIGLLFYYYLIKKNGHRIVYLGQSVPFSDLELILKMKPCNYLVTSFSSNFSGIDVEKYILNLSSTFQEQKIYFSVYEGGVSESRLPPNVLRIKNTEHLRDVLQHME